MICSNRASYRLHGVLGSAARVCRHHYQVASQKPGFSGAYEINTPRLRCAVEVNKETGRRVMVQDLTKVITSLDAISDKAFILSTKPVEQIEFRLHDIANDIREALAMVEMMEFKARYDR